ncbi:putative GAG-pre-integrase domain-containing protein [Dioscorea sansibarensis]
MEEDKVNLDIVTIASVQTTTQINVGKSLATLHRSIKLLRVQRIVSPVQAPVLLQSSLQLHQSLFIPLQNLQTMNAIGGRYEKNGLYYLSADAFPIAFATQFSPVQIHHRLGHPSLSVLKRQFPELESVKSLDCKACQLGKYHKSSFFARKNKKEALPFAFVHVIYGILAVLVMLRVINIFWFWLMTVRESLGSTCYMRNLKLLMLLRSFLLK